ncbi:hypothetical protein [Streptomyces parvus]|nr:hypothetical protein [Streptomyces parvus]MCQ1575368.1 hypothetical protein [Streptomyces parvus]
MTERPRSACRQFVVDLITLPMTWLAIALTLLAASIIWATIEGWTP